MLPEQIWDAPDLPEMGLKLGKPTGAAMPLVWAHAEYVKLLRSVTDGEVFDRISAVAERYGQRQTAHARSRSSASTGNCRASLREESCGCWRMSTFSWCGPWMTGRRSRTTESRNLGCAGHFADMETEPGKAGRVIFTLHWRLQDRWEGRNFEVQLDPLNRRPVSAGSS